MISHAQRRGVKVVGKVQTGAQHAGVGAVAAVLADHNLGQQQAARQDAHHVADAAAVEQQALVGQLVRVHVQLALAAGGKDAADVDARVGALGLRAHGNVVRVVGGELGERAAERAVAAGELRVEECESMKEKKRKKKRNK